MKVRAGGRARTTPHEPRPAAAPTSQRTEQCLAHPGGLFSPLLSLHIHLHKPSMSWPSSSSNPFLPLFLLPHLCAPPGWVGPRSSWHPGSVGWHFPPLYRHQPPKTAEWGSFPSHSLPVPTAATKAWPTDHMVGIFTAGTEAEASSRECEDCATSDIPIPSSVPPSPSGTT